MCGCHFKGRSIHIFKGYEGDLVCKVAMWRWWWVACRIGLGSVAQCAIGGCLSRHSLPCSDPYRGGGLCHQSPRPGMLIRHPAYMGCLSGTQRMCQGHQAPSICVKARDACQAPSICVKARDACQAPSICVKARDACQAPSKRREWPL